MNHHVLFVDDEPSILEGLRRMLRPLRGEWDMRFVSNGYDALDLLDQGPCDVLVTDMRMPGMSGAQLLDEVTTRHPEIIRIVLSGAADKDNTIAAIGPAHQFIGKPCDTETLQHALDRALKLRERISSEAIALLISSVKTLPSVLSVYLELTKELQSSGGSAKSVARIIASDTAMTARILQVANSAFFGHRQDVVTPFEAVTVLGFDAVRSMALSGGVLAGASAKPLQAFVEQLWRHSLTTATFAKIIAQREKADAITIDAAVTTGLLHDVGKLVLAMSKGTEYLELLRSARDAAVDPWQREQETYGVSHADVGEYLLSLWALPDRITEVAAYHHRPHEVESEGLTPLVAVHVANRLAHEFADQKDQARIDMDYLETCGLAHRVDDWKAACWTTVQ